ncbi:hypothetical protein [Geobacter sp. OR-1]|uniref:hypothetical protein n=1 Tax=Geobacter sp. OR-1 TaxID=1266765 RepID=UPI00126A7904|nr:hypothetical protein [Geobacter sp. OR-1]
MNKTLLLLAASTIIAGCATSTILNDGTRSKVFIPCNNSALCFSDNSYDIIWDYACADYPISYRAKQSEYRSSRSEYIYHQEIVTER